MFFYLFFFIFIVKSDVLTAETLVQLEKLTLQGECNNNIYYTKSKWFMTENQSKTSFYSKTSDNQITEIFSYQTEHSISNFICLNSIPYFLDNGKISKLTENNGKFEIISISHSPLSIDTFKMIEINGKIKGVCSMSVFPGKTLEESKTQFEMLETQNYRIYDDLMIRRWDSYWDGQFNHLFTFEGTPDSIEIFNDIMNDKKFDCPARPFGGNEEFDISPNGDVFAFSILLENPASSLNNNIYIAQFEKPTEWKGITEHNYGYDNQPVFNEDGSILYFFQMDEKKDESDRSVLMRYVMNSEVVESITGDVDLSFTVPILIKGNYIHLSTVIEGNGVIVGFDSSVPVTRESIHVLTQNGTSGNFVPFNNGFVYEHHNFTLPTELFYFEKETQKISQFTETNSDVLASITFGKVDEIRYTGANDDTIHAFVIYPPNMEENKKYPVILYTHGGPESPWQNNFHYRWNPQVIAAQGYIVLAPNFHGSGSYGDAFLKAIRSNWGGWPYEDLMKGVDYFLEHEHHADETRLGAMGASYGGYMMNWINANTDRFKCIICHDGIIDAEGSYYYMDEMYFLEVEFGYPYYENKTFYESFSPLNKIENYKTPQLTIHGGTDYRIDVVAGYQQFVTLQRKGIDSKLVVYPEENHWVLRPHNSIDWHKEVFAWLNKYLSDE